MTSLIGIKQNTRVLAGLDEGQEEIITTNYRTINVNIGTTIVSARTSNIISYLAGGAINTTKTIAVVGQYKLTLQTNFGTFLLDKNNTPITLTFDTTTGGWIDKTDTVRPLPLSMKKKGENITPNDASGDSVQSVCAINAAGDTIVIGGYGDGLVGAVWVFLKDTNGQWQQDGAKIKPPGVLSSSVRFGASVAIVDQLIIIGADNYPTGGSTFIYERRNGKWTNTHILFASGATGAHQGAAVAATASTIVSADSTASGNTGEIYIWTKIGNNWAYAQTIAGAAPADNFGCAVDIKGQLLAVGAPGNAGYIRVYKKTTIWQQVYQFTDTIPGNLVGLSITIDPLEQFIATITSGLYLMIFPINPTADIQKVQLSVPPAPISYGSVAINATGDIIYAATYEYKAIDMFKKNASGVWELLPGVSAFITPSPGKPTRQGINIAAAANTLLVGDSLYDDAVGGVYVWNATNDAINFSNKILQGSDYTRASRFGSSVAMSANGRYAIVGGISDGISDTGSAWKYERNGSTWTEYKKIINDIHGYGYFGVSVSMNDTGDAYIIGSYDDYAHIYKNDTLELLLYGPNEGAPVNNYFGRSVVMSNDGNAIAIGSHLYGTTGAIWYYTKTANVWSKIAGPIVPTGGVPSTHLTVGLYSGDERHDSMSLAISYDGRTVAAGSGDHASANGAVWVYYDGVEQAAQLQGAATIASHQGASVALSADGNIMAVGATTYGGTSGAVIIWTRSGTVWTESTKITVAGSRLLGFAVSLSADGNILMASEGITLTAVNEGVWVFENVAGVWTARTTSPIVAGGGVYFGGFTEPLFGHSLSLSGDGAIALIGEPGRYLSGGVYSIG